MGVVPLVLGPLIAGLVLRRQRMIIAAIRRVSADNLHERLAAQGPADEAKDLADTIDELLQRLESSFAAMPVRRRRLPRTPHTSGHNARVPGRGPGQAGARASADHRTRTGRPDPPPAPAMPRPSPA
ncbi:hypothetical protein [Nonomuraea sp. NPDC049684]|uniref:hypothetical protein n=1 Tax=Nonomuraea sp. NPDC049684 TaxID=3364356 RepID=UPI0037968014